MPSRCIASCYVAWAALLLLGGCAQTPYATQGQVGNLQQQQSQLTQQNKQLEERAKALDSGNRELETQLAQSRQQTVLLQDQLVAVKEQLGTVNTQLAQVRDERRALEQKLAASLSKPAATLPDNEVAKRPGVFSNSSMSRKLPEFNVPGIESRVDGDTIRIELPGDALFDPSDSRLKQSAFPLIDNVLVEIERRYPQQYIGIEGNLDNEPPKNNQYSNNHQLSSARATALFDYMVARSQLRPMQLSVVGHGGNHPIVSNATTAGRARNRRMEIVIYPERIGDR